MKNSEFKPVKLFLKIDLVSNRAYAEGFGIYIYIALCIYASGTYDILRVISQYFFKLFFIGKVCLPRWSLSRVKPRPAVMHAYNEPWLLGLQSLKKFKLNLC